MRKTNTPTLKQLVLCAFFATAAVSLSHASTITENYQQRSVIDFEKLGIGAAPTVATTEWEAWTGSAATQGAAPNDPGHNSSGVALSAPGNTRLAGFSPQQVNPLTAADEMIYFSAWIYRTANTTSGARITISETNTGGGLTNKLAGFGVFDTAGKTFAFYNGSNNTWIESDVKAADNAWYEMALVIEINATDISKSLGSLYVRNVTANQTDFTLITFDGGTKTAFEMSWFTDDWNARDSYAYWRYDNFRSGATGITQIDNLAVGVVAIPEPSVAFLGVGGLLLIPLLRARLYRKS